MNIKAERLNAVDTVRAIAIISMILYHGFWDLANFGVLPQRLLNTIPVIFWQQSICVTFIAVSGFCFNLSKRPLKNGLIIFIAGALITAVTLVFMPRNKIVFGILTFLGCAVLITWLINHMLKRINPEIGLIIFLLFFVLSKNINTGYFAGVKMPDFLYSGYIATFFGFMDKSFFSSDYFPILPWYFMYLTGYYLYLLMKKHNLLRFLVTPEIPVINAVGRYSLLIYLIHQPVLYLIVMAVCRLN